MARAPVFLRHSSSLAHDTGSHPERPARIVAIEGELEARGWLGLERISSSPVDRSVLEAVHPPQYVATIQQLADAGGGHLDLDTVASPGSFEAALHSAGGAVELVDLLVDGETPWGFSSHRPPGHHAEAARAMGFCLFNNAAVAARYALDRRGLERILILDWDVHHGNGINDIFHSSKQVLYASIHQSPLYPGTGPASDVGSGEGRGYTINMPVPPGSGDSVFVSLVEHVVVPVMLAFAPQLVLISAGYDAHGDDPLGSCRVTEAGFASMAGVMRRAATELEAPLGCILEGGYAVAALARSVAATVEALSGSEGVGGIEEVQVAPLAREARLRLRESWPGLA